MQKIALAIHGGAGTITRSSMTPEKEAAYTNALQAALEAGYNELCKGASSTEAVLQAVMSLEDCPLFNAGKGSVFNNQGIHEMDASIMEGQALKAGAVSLIRNIKNPIVLARAVMEKSPHVFMAGSGAEEFAKKMGIEFRTDDYFHDDFRYAQWQQVMHEEGVHLDHSVAATNHAEKIRDKRQETQEIAASKKDGLLSSQDKKFGTVGAVALDTAGNLAAATSTGGMTNKKFGRIGDSPMIGAGTYANNETCAISCTGHGELFIRSVVAHDISCLMAYKNLSLREACQEVVMKKLVAIGGEGGLIAIDKNGNIELPFNSEGMYRASINTAGQIQIAIYK